MDIQTILSLLENNDYEAAQIRCEEALSVAMTAFMENLTVDTATDYLGLVLLYTRICSLLKKPWKAFPKLEAARGGLRFIKDFMSDDTMLAETFASFGDGYAYGGYLPEAVLCYKDSASFFFDPKKASEALSNAFYYERRFGKELVEDVSLLEEKIGADLVEKIKEDACQEADGQILVDPIESTEEFLKVRFETEQFVDDFLRNNSSADQPFCQMYWNAKQTILKEKFGIDWKTPAEMNPNIRFY